MQNFPLDIHIYPGKIFAYYSKGHHSTRYFRQELQRTRGIAFSYGTGVFEFCYANEQLQPCFQRQADAFPITIWHLL